jgi:hypothetical protein
MTALPPHDPWRGDPPDAPPGRKLTVWVIYERPLDYPQGYVLRPQYALPGGEVALSQWAWTAPSAEAIRRSLPPGLYCEAAKPGDDPVILEVWF